MWISKSVSQLTGRVGKERDQQRERQSESKWEEKTEDDGGDGTEGKKMRMCAEVLCLGFWFSMLRREKCDMQLWISNCTLVYFAWEERKRTKCHSSSSQFSRSQIKAIHMCTWRTPLPYFTIKCWGGQLLRNWFHGAIKESKEFFFPFPSLWSYCYVTVCSVVGLYSLPSALLQVFRVNSGPHYDSGLKLGFSELSKIQTATGLKDFFCI